MQYRNGSLLPNQMIGGVQMKKKKIFDEEVYRKLRTTVSNCDPSHIIVPYKQI